MNTPTDPSARPAAGAHTPARRPALRWLLAPAAVLALAVAIAGCGSSSDPGVAHVGTTSTTGTTSSGSSSPGGGAPESGESSSATQQKLVKYAQCMRTHGEPQFPEPTEGHITLHSQNGSGPNPESPQWKAAEKACASLAPALKAPSPEQTAKLQEAALKMAECMRHHGVPNFPDPTFSSSGGGVRVTQKIGKSSGINPGSPQFQAAQKACQGDLPFKANSSAPAPGGGPEGSQSSGTVGAP